MPSFDIWNFSYFWKSNILVFDISEYSLPLNGVSLNLENVQAVTFSHTSKFKLQVVWFYFPPFGVCVCWCVCVRGEGSNTDTWWPPAGFPEHQTVLTRSMAKLFINVCYATLPCLLGKMRTSLPTLSAWQAPPKSLLMQVYNSHSQSDSWYIFKWGGVFQAPAVPISGNQSHSNMWISLCQIFQSFTEKPRWAWRQFPRVPSAALRRSLFTLHVIGDFSRLIPWGLEWKMKVTQSCPTSCNPMDCSPTRLLCPWNSPGKNTGVGSCSLFQRIFPTQGLDPGFPHCKRILNLLSHRGGPNFLTKLYPHAQQSTWHQEGLPETLTRRREEIYWKHSEEEERKGKERGREAALRNQLGWEVTGGGWDRLGWEKVWAHHCQSQTCSRRVEARTTPPQGQHAASSQNFFTELTQLLTSSHWFVLAHANWCSFKLAFAASS